LAGTDNVSKNVNRANRLLVAAALAASVTVGGLSGYLGAQHGHDAEPSRVASVGILPETVPPATAFRNAGRRQEMPPVDTYEDALATIHNRYYGKLPSTKDYTTDQTLTYAAIRGMLDSLGDRYTRFLSPTEYADMLDKNRGEFSGIGAHLDARAQQVIIVDTIEGSPARKAGLKAGDQIVKVDNTSVVNMAVDDAVKLIRGERGTTVRLTVERKGSPKPLVFRVVRDIVEVDIVKSEMLPGNVGYISLAEFNDQADRKVEAALADLQAKGAQALILDLRWNPGGLLDQAVRISSRFIPRGGPVVWIKERGGRPESQDTVRLRRVSNMPVVVLVNKFSASASEIVAGAVQDTNSGTVVGVTTWGKGLVQTINPIPTDNSAVLITTHRYYTPKMTDINEKGIVPDVMVDVTEKDFAEYQKTRKVTDDPQVRKAMEVLRGKMGASTATATDQQAPIARAASESLLCRVGV